MIIIVDKAIINYQVNFAQFCPIVPHYLSVSQILLYIVVGEDALISTITINYGMQLFDC